MKGARLSHQTSPMSCDEDFNRDGTNVMTDSSEPIGRKHCEAKEGGRNKEVPKACFFKCGSCQRRNLNTISRSMNPGKGRERPLWWRWTNVYECAGTHVAFVRSFSSKTFNEALRPSPGPLVRKQATQRTDELAPESSRIGRLTRLLQPRSNPRTLARCCRHCGGRTGRGSCSRCSRCSARQGGSSLTKRARMHLCPWKRTTKRENTRADCGRRSWH